MLYVRCTYTYRVTDLNASWFGLVISRVCAQQLLSRLITTTCYDVGLDFKYGKNFVFILG